MQYSAVLLAGFAALVSAQSYTGPGVTPTASAPAGCSTNYAGTFGLSVVNVTSSSSKVKRDSSPNALTITLKNGVLTDQTGRIGYIASNYQFQFDLGGQAGELATAGFSVCANNSLALGGSAIWYECLSGTFYNLYDRSWAAQCLPVYLDALPMSSSSTSTVVSTATTGSASATTSASAVTSSVAAASSITDGQIQGGSTSKVTSSVQVVSSVSVSTSSAAIITSISDHQIQGATSTSAVVSSATIVSTITPTTKAVTTGAIVSSISDHQIQAPTTTVAPYTGAAAMPTAAAQLLLAAAGVAAALL